MSKENGGAAFPMKGMETRNGQGIEQIYERGMTLRDYFAAKALQGMLANVIECLPQDVPHVAASAYILADAMLAERAK